MAQTITINIDDVSEKIFDSWLGKGGIESWLKTALANKLRKLINRTIVEISDKRPEALSWQQKIEIIANTNLPSREERNQTIDIGGE